MNLFGKKPQEVAFGILMHEINRAQSGIRFGIKSMKGGTVESGIRTINSYLKVISDNMDKYYKEFNADFPDKEWDWISW